jgi:hypothetical protein
MLQKDNLRAAEVRCVASGMDARENRKSNARKHLLQN